MSIDTTNEQKQTRKDMGDKMAGYFEGRKLPKEIKFPGEHFTDVPGWVAKHLIWLKSMKTSSANWKLAYMRLYKIKTYLDHEKN